MVHSLEGGEGEVGLLQVNREAVAEAVVVVGDLHLGVAVAVGVGVPPCCPAEGEEAAAAVREGPTGEVGVAAEVAPPRPSGSVRWRPG